MLHLEPELNEVVMHSSAEQESIQIAAVLKKKSAAMLIRLSWSEDPLSSVWCCRRKGRKTIAACRSGKIADYCVIIDAYP